MGCANGNTNNSSKHNNNDKSNNFVVIYHYNIPLFDGQLFELYMLIKYWYTTFITLTKNEVKIMFGLTM